MSNNQDKSDQIPSSDNIGKTEKIISDQGGIEGQRKETNVEDYAKTAQIGDLLKNIDYPVDKHTIVRTLQNNHAKPDVIDAIRKIEDKQYNNTFEVLESAKMVYT